MTMPDDMPTERLRNGWLSAGGERYTVLCIAFSKAAIECEESPQQAAQMLDELLRSVPADVIRVIPPMSPAAVRIVMEADKLDPAEGKRITIDDEVKFVPVHPESFKLLTGPMFWELCQMTPGTLDALTEIEDARRPQQPARCSQLRRPKGPVRWDAGPQGDVAPFRGGGDLRRGAEPFRQKTNSSDGRLFRRMWFLLMRPIIGPG